MKPNKEFIVCSAVDIYGTIVTGLRHKDCYKTYHKITNRTIVPRADERSFQGFLTSHNRFVTRAEAFKIAKENDQIIHKLFDDVEEGELTSEDLYGCDE